MVFDSSKSVFVNLRNVVYLKINLLCKIQEAKLIKFIVSNTGEAVVIQEEVQVSARICKAGQVDDRD
ncbi:hypothetical protein DPMN_050642 [Dreissena polymorpha]|uniref:Uncharacterized protein n=1 Tax=Dreissena polymorpha TaxID=45954 RepID=A0A9D4CGI1_DREPO|nr:hypothetical protein DPMN_050642 [Dreissena polymorpha]